MEAAATTVVSQSPHSARERQIGTWDSAWDRVWHKHERGKATRNSGLASSWEAVLSECRGEASHAADLHASAWEQYVVPWLKQHSMDKPPTRLEHQLKRARRDARTTMREREDRQLKYAMKGRKLLKDIHFLFDKKMDKQVKLEGGGAEAGGSKHMKDTVGRVHHQIDELKKAASIPEGVYNAIYVTHQVTCHPIRHPPS